MTQATVGEIKTVTATIPSGAGTSSGIYLGGFGNFNLFVPTLTSAALSFIAPTGGDGYAAFRTQAGAVITAQPTAGTGAMWLDANALLFLAGYPGQVRISAAAAQGANRDFVWTLKG